MSAFITQLAGMALGHGTPGDAHVKLPPRFAPPPSAHFGQTEWPPADSSAAAAGQVPSPLRHPLHAGRRETADGDEAPPVRLPDAKAAPVVKPVVITPRLPRPSSELPQQRRHNAAPAKSDVARSSRRDAVVMPRQPADNPVPPSRRDSTAASAIVVLPAASPVAPMPRRDTSPLSDVALASRVTRPEAAPVIHVTIDRIDVRAPDLSKPVAPSKPTRRQPAVSLAEYLRNGRSGSLA
jgi:hypothetical protein